MKTTSPDHGISDIEFFHFDTDDSFVGIARITFYNQFEIYPIRVFKDNEGLKVLFPKSRQSGSWRDLFHPLTAEARAEVNEIVKNFLGNSDFDRSPRRLTPNDLVVRYRPYDGRDGLTGFADITLDERYFLNSLQIFGSEIRGPRFGGRALFSIIEFRDEGKEIFGKAFQSTAGTAAFTWEAKHACPPPEELIPKKNPDFIPSRDLSGMAKFDLNLMEDFDWLIGTDEVGTGALAGPVGAAAVSYPRQIIETPPEELKGITDSKRLSEKDRERYAEVIKKYATYEIVVKDIPKAERWTPTIKIVITESVDRLADRLNGKKRVIIDSGPSNPDFSYDFERIKGGDIFSLSIASAAILAKVERDQIMKKLSEEFPQYKWNKNKGYSSLDHTDAIRRYGKSKYHRETASKEH